MLAVSLHFFISTPHSAHIDVSVPARILPNVAYVRAFPLAESSSLASSHCSACLSPALSPRYVCSPLHPFSSLHSIKYFTFSPHVEPDILSNFLCTLGRAELGFHCRRNFEYCFILALLLLPSAFAVAVLFNAFVSAFIYRIFSFRCRSSLFHLTLTCSST
ncbi:hypothetical protein C8J56DRAFT_958051, partial [Mycena floridula]